VSDLIDRLARRAASRTREQTSTPPFSSRDRELDAVAHWLTHTPVSRRKMLQVTGASVVGFSVLHSVPAQAASPAARPRVQPMRVTGQTPDDGDCTPCNPQYDPCCITEQGNVCSNNAICCPPGTKACVGAPPEGVCCQPNDPCYVDASGSPACCAPTQQCGTICCSTTDVCTDSSAGTCCASGQACGTTCCPDGQTCLDPSTGVCCDPKQVSGKTCCPSGQFPCDEQNGTCCATTGGSCCPVGAPGTSSYVCCDAGTECVNQILPGNSGITAGSPKVCCPPSQLVTATTQHICCPPGSVVQPQGGLSTAGGLCCTAANVCGQNCCESGLPSFSKVCVKGECHWKDVVVAQQKATANPDGNVPVPLSFSAGAQGTVSLQNAATGSNATAAAAKPIVVGTAHFKIKHASHQKIDVKLNRAARQHLAKARKLSVEAIITFTQDGKSESVSTPFTIKAPPRRHQRRSSH
jgi:hypothetical protein